MKKIFYSLLFYIFLVLYSIIGSRLIKIDNNYQNDILNMDKISVVVLFLSGSLVETIIFSLLPFIILKFFNIKNYKYIIVLSSVLFALTHSSSFEFILITFIAGLVFNTNFYKYYINLGYFPAFISTFLLHFFNFLKIYLLVINISCFSVSFYNC